MGKDDSKKGTAEKIIEKFEENTMKENVKKK